MSFMPPNEVAEIFFTGLRNTMMAFRKKIASLTSDNVGIDNAVSSDDDSSSVADYASDPDALDMMNREDSSEVFDDGVVEEMINSEDSSDAADNAVNDMLNDEDSSKATDEEVNEMTEETMKEGDEDSESDYESMGFELVG